jgi:hypothetical protein
MIEKLDYKETTPGFLKTMIWGIKEDLSYLFSPKTEKEQIIEDFKLTLDNVNEFKNLVSKLYKKWT